MKITVDKNLTTVAQLANVKASLKEFKATWNETDLFRHIAAQLEDLDDMDPAFYNASLLAIEGEAFPVDLLGDDIHISLDIIAQTYSNFWKITCFVDKDGAMSITGDFGEKLYRVTRFDAVR